MKHKVLNLVLSGLFVCTALASCTGQAQSPDKIDNPKTFVDSNLLEQEEKVPTKYDSINFESYDGLTNEYRIANSQYENYGLLFVYNQTGHGGLYSLTANKFLVECQYYHEWLDYEVKGDENALFIKVDYENEIRIFDNHGNVLYSESYNPDHYRETFWDVKNVYVNGSVYSELFINNEYPKIYRYDLGEAVEVYSIPDPVIPPVIEEDERHHYQPGDLFKEGHVTDLAEFGKDGFYLNGSRSGVVTLFDDLDNAISTFIVPTDCEPILTKNNIYYQKLFPLAEDNNTFDVYFENEKYAMETYSIDLMSGVQSKITFPYLIKNVTPCKDIEGKLTKNIIDMAGINEYKTLNVTRTYLVNEDLEIEADYSEIHPESFIKIEENYYNTKTNILYDENLEVITYLEYMTPELMLDHELFVGSVDGYKGIIDYKGNVVVPFEYQNIIYNDDFDYIILKDDQGYYLYDLNTKFKTFSAYDASLRVIDQFNGIYTFETKDDAFVVTLDGRHSDIFDYGLYGKSYEFNRIFNVDIKNDNKMLFLEYLVNDGVKQYVFEYNKKEMSYNSYGSENYKAEHTGRNIQDAIIVNSGSNMIHANPTGDLTYVKLENPTSGYYYLNTTTHDGMSIDSAFISSYENNREETHEIDSFEGNRYLLDSKYDYYFALNFRGYRCLKIELLNVASGFSGQKETIDYYSSYPTIKKVNVLTETYYKFNDYESSLDYEIYSYSKYGQNYNSIATYNYDGGKVITLNKGVYYFLLENNGYNEAYYSLNTYEYADLLTVTSDAIYLENGESALRKFKVAENGKYILSTTAKIYDIYQYNGMHGDKTILDCKYYDSLRYYELEKDVTYIARIKNNSSADYFNIAIKKLTYDDLKSYEVGTDTHYFYSYQDNNFVRKVISDQDIYFYFSGTSYSSDYPTIYHINEDNTYEVSEGISLDGTLVYNLKANEKYVFRLNRVNSSYTMHTYIYTLDNLPNLNTSTYYDEDRYVKYTPTKTGIYNIDITSDDYDIDVLAKNSDGNFETIVPAHTEGDLKFYQLNQNESYIIKTTDTTVYSHSYKYIANYLAENASSIPEYVIDEGGFTKYDTYYMIRGRNGSMYFNAYTKGKLTFDYRTYIDYSYYTYFYVYVNGVNKLPYTNSTRTGSLSLNLNPGDVVEFKLDYNYSNDYFKVENLVFEAANVLKLNVKDVPSDVLNGNTLYMWAWSDTTNGKFYSGIYDSTTSTYNFKIPDTCTSFLLCVAPENAVVSWDMVVKQTENIAIQTGLTEYSCATGWKDKQ